MEQYVISIKSDGENNAGLPLLHAMVPGITNQYPIPLNLTEDQGEIYFKQKLAGKKEFNVRLVKGQLKPGKSGDYKNEFYWEVAMFEGVPNQRVIDNYNSELSVAVPASSDVTTPSVPHPVYDLPRKPAGDWTDNPDDRTMSIIRQVAFKEAAAKGGTFEEIAECTNIFTLIILGKYPCNNTGQGLVDTLLQDGANIVGIRDEEPQPIWTYPPIEDRVNVAVFNHYCSKAGWNSDDVTDWLGGELIDWIEQGEGRSTKAALEKCREDAIEQGILMPPEDFRVEVKA
jgi:hypothetical protein